MSSIALFTAHHRFPWSRQLASRTEGAWEITLGAVRDDCRLLVVYDDLDEPVKTVLPRENRLVILSEPPGIKTYAGGYLDQFGTVLGPIEPKGHAGRWLCEQPALPWFFGIGFDKPGLSSNLDFDTLAALEPPAKQPVLTAILSSKAKLPKHRARLAFAERLKQRLGDRFLIFGRGFAPIDDKAEAILPYAYHFVLENNDIPHFWTEKTADAYLGWALPVFSGCPNISDYFPDSSFEAVEIADEAGALDSIERLLDENPYVSRLPAIAEARKRLLGPYNLANRLREIAQGIPDAEKSASPTILRANADFSLYHRLRKAIRKRLK